MKKGFTLIELLVVVLIIGILAAVAWPQYEIAVEKARTAEPMIVLRNMRDAQELYYLANGSYAGAWEELEIQKPDDSKFWRYQLSSDGTSISALRNNVGPDKSYLLTYRTQKAVKQGWATIACGTYASGSSEFIDRICKALGAREKDITGRWILSK